MAVTISESNHGYTHVVGSMSGLQYTAENYDWFGWELYKWDGSAWQYQSWIGNNPADHTGTTSWTQEFTDNQPGCAYYVRFYAQYQGTWYSFISGTWTSTDYIPDATFSNNSTQKTTITFDYTNSAGTMSLFVWNGSAYVGIASSGLPYNKTGDTITLNTLLPNQGYSFIVRTYVESWYSETTYVTYTTQDWMTIPSGVVLGSSGRYNGGMFVSWGDHGYESSGFHYYLQIDGGTVQYSSSYLNYSYDAQDYSVQHNFRVVPNYNGYPPSGTQGWYYDSSHYTSLAYIWTAPHYPTGISIGTKTSSSIALTATGMTGLYSAVEWRYRVYGSGSGWSSSIDYGGSMSVTLSSLSSYTNYEIDVYGYYGTSGVTSVGHYDITTYTKPSTFSWTTSISQGGGIYGYDLANYRLKILTAVEWNAFTTRINQYRAYLGYGGYTFTTVSTNTAMTASIINEAITAINAMSPPTSTPSSVSSGNTITAYIFTRLRDSLNSL